MTAGTDGAGLLLGPAATRAQPPAALSDQLVLQDMPGYLARRLDSRAAALFEQHTGQAMLTPRQFGLLQVVRRAGVIQQSELAAQLHLDRSTLGEMLGRMTDRGLVARRESARDRRTSSVEVTDAGRDALLSVIRGAIEAQVALLAPLPDYLRPVFMKCLALIADADLAGDPGSRGARVPDTRAPDARAGGARAGGAQAGHDSMPRADQGADRP